MKVDGTSNYGTSLFLKVQIEAGDAGTQNWENNSACPNGTWMKSWSAFGCIWLHWCLSFAFMEEKRLPRS